MRRTILIILICLSSNFVWSQNVFNRIIEDTNKAHIMNSVVVLDTGYVFLSGTDNEFGVRCFALTYLSENGDKEWKHVYGEDVLQYWEGWNGNLKKSNDGYYLAGTIEDPNAEKKGIHISVFDNTFDLILQNIIMYDTINKKAFFSRQTLDKDYFITGQIYNNNDESYKLLLTKTDSIGNYMWHKVFGSNVYEYGSYIVETSNGNILTGGDTWVTHSNNTRWYLLKTDTAGNIIWERTFGQSNYNNGHVQGLIETSDSNYLACGAYPVARYGGGGGEYLWDGCLRKIDTNGNLIWEKLHRNYSCHPTGDNITTSGTFTSLQELPDGDIILLGSSHWYYTILRGFLMRIDKDGNIKWHRYYFAEDYTSSWQYLVNLQLAIDGGYILAGYGNEYDLFGYNPPQQAWLVKTDSLGLDGLCNTEIPELNIDIEFPETVNCSDTITVYAYIAGKSAPYTIETSIGQLIDSIYYPSTFVPVEIGLTHVNLEWDNSTYFEETITEATLSNHEWGQCIAKPIEFYTPHTPGSQQISITVTDAYGERKTITKEIFVNDNCGSWIADEVINPVNLYPNPTRNFLYVNITHTDLPVSCYIYNSVGQIVKTTTIHKGLNVINVSEFASGNYIVKIIGGKENFNLSFEKEK